MMRCSALLLLAACAQRVTIVDMLDEAAWSLSEADPFADRPGDPNCPPRGIGWGAETLIEPRSIEVNTGACAFFGISQPSLVPLRKGQRIDLRVNHGALLADEPAEAHVAVLIGPHIVFEDRIAIPADEPRSLVASYIVPERIDAGADVLLHLHNHGDNTWNFIEISTGPDDGDVP